MVLSCVGVYSCRIWNFGTLRHWGDCITSLLGILFGLERIGVYFDIAWDRMDRVDIGTLRVEIGIFIGMAGRGLGSLLEKMIGYGIGSVFYACPTYLVIGRTYPCHEDLFAWLFSSD